MMNAHTIECKQNMRNHNLKCSCGYPESSKPPASAEEVARKYCDDDESYLKLCAAITEATASLQAENVALDAQLRNQQGECHTIRRAYLHEKACKEAAEAERDQLRQQLDNSVAQWETATAQLAAAQERERQLREWIDWAVGSFHLDRPKAATASPENPAQKGGD